MELGIQFLLLQSIQVTSLGTIANGSFDILQLEGIFRDRINEKYPYKQRKTTKESTGEEIVNHYDHYCICFYSMSFFEDF